MKVHSLLLVLLEEHTLWLSIFSTPQDNSGSMIMWIYSCIVTCPFYIFYYTRVSVGRASEGKPSSSKPGMASILANGEP